MENKKVYADTPFTHAYLKSLDTKTLSKSMLKAIEENALSVLSVDTVTRIRRRDKYFFEEYLQIELIDGTVIEIYSDRCDY